METDFLPQHLRKYVVEQHYEKYTPVDQAVWRYILRQLRAYLSTHAHECYREGLEKTGIDVECIPHISEVSAKLEKFGWRAIPVSGFIPPATFMELQSLGVLPVASDMRTLDHLLYTPAPDIVHEAAGHAPILVHPEFSQYLRLYAQIAKKAIISKEDLDLYEALRELSDIKENPTSTLDKIKEAEDNLEQVSKNISHISEASELSRMNWWTVEYGLIGPMNDPKLFGAGLLSSVGEAKWCLSPKVRRIPLTVDCIKTTYDITEPQPQLFVTPDFKTLETVLEQMAETMAYRLGGLEGLNKAIKAQSVNTAELDSGIQISGQIVEIITVNKQPAYLRLLGPSQLSYQDKEINGHGKTYHSEGFGTPVGFLKDFPGKNPCELSAGAWAQIDADIGNITRLEFESGVVVTGKVKSRVVQDGKIILLTLTEAKAALGDQVLFAPEWGTYDMALGTSVTSVFGGPADRIAYGETSDFTAKRVPAPKYSAAELARHAHYGKVRRLREEKIQGDILLTELKDVFDAHRKNFPDDWLLPLEALEIAKARITSSSLEKDLENYLDQLGKKDEKTHSLILDGLALAGVL